MIIKLVNIHTKAHYLYEGNWKEEQIGLSPESMYHMDPYTEWRPITKECWLFQPIVVLRACDVSENPLLIVSLSQ